MEVRFRCQVNLKSQFWKSIISETDGALETSDLSLKADAPVRCEACKASYTVDVERLNNLIEFSEQLLQEDAHGLLGKPCFIVGFVRFGSTSAEDP